MLPTSESPHSQTATTVLNDPLWGKLTQVIPHQVSTDDARLLPPLSIRFSFRRAPRLRKKPNDLLDRLAVAGRVWTHLRGQGVRPLPRVVFPQSSWPCGHAFSEGFVDLVFKDDGAHSAALHCLHRFAVHIGGEVLFEQIAWCGALPHGLYSIDCVLIGEAGTAAWLMAARVDELSRKLEKISKSLGKSVAVTRAECKCCSDRITSPTAILRSWFRTKAHVTHLVERLPPAVYLEDGESYPLVLCGVPGSHQLSPSLALATGSSRGWRRLEGSHIDATPSQTGDVAATA